MVLAPEHPLVAQIATGEQRSEVEAYVEAAGHSTEIERQSTEREKSGVFTGAYCVNHLTGERVAGVDRGLRAAHLWHRRG